MLSLKPTNRANVCVPTTQVKKYAYGTFSYLISACLLSAYFVSRIRECIAPAERSSSLCETAHRHVTEERETGCC